MLHEKKAFAQRIIDYYQERGVECSVVDEHLCLLITISGAGLSHGFRCGNRLLAGMHRAKKFAEVLEREAERLEGKIEKSAEAEAGRRSVRAGSCRGEALLEELRTGIYKYVSGDMS